MQKPNWPQNPQTQQNIKISSTPSYLNQPQSTDLKYLHNVKDKGALLGSKPKTLEIQPNENKFIVYSSQQNIQNAKTKSFPLNQLSIQHKSREKRGKPDQLKINTNNGKKYTLDSHQSSKIIGEIKQGQNAYQINKYQFQEQPMIYIPKTVNYTAPLATNQFQQKIIPQNTLIFTQQYPLISTLQTQLLSHKKQDFSHYPRRKFYLNPLDWKVEKQKGTILFINEEKRSNQKKVITWVIKKFLTTGSFNGISYPTFVMKPQSILETYAHAIGAVPWLFDSVINPVQRMKKFVCLIQTFSLLCCDTTKPFNPPLGQTFQAKIANGNYYAQQIVHHPPVSAFFYEGKGFKISGCFEMTASIGPNSAKGSFNGDLKVYFDDGVTYIGRIPCGEFSGFLFGDEKFETYGTFYAYSTKRLVFSGSIQQKRNFFQGYIGKLKQMQEQEFFTMVESPERFAKFPFYDRQSFDTVFSSMEMNYGYNIKFDGKEYFNTEDHNYLPFLAEPIPDKRILLKSDSRFRKDIPLRALMKFQQAQVQKEKLQQEQRYFRKLRVKYDPLHHQHS